MRLTQPICEHPDLPTACVYLVTTGKTLEGKLDRAHVFHRAGREPISITELEPCLVTKAPVSSATAQEMIAKIQAMKKDT